MDTTDRKRVVFENVEPEIDCGRFPIKRVAGEKVIVTADIFADGHEALSATLLYRHFDDPEWRESPMSPLGNDRWRGEFTVEKMGTALYTLEAWVDRFKTWRRDVQKNREAGQPLSVDLQVGAAQVEEAAGRASAENRVKLLRDAQALRQGGEDEAFFLALSPELSARMSLYPEKKFAARYEKELKVTVDRRKADFSSWYEIFPRSCSAEPGRHGTLADVERLLPEISRMGFDVLYLPPVHPIGITNRKGKNNSLQVEAEDVGSPWAIGSAEGGHKAVHPRLGTLEDFSRLVRKAGELGIEIALDLAFQCSPDHPYVKEHPEWFRWRPDGRVQFAENPPKKYEDIIPLNFETEDWESLWEELKSIVLFWIGKGVRIFRVDNPHTKPFVFWEWLIGEIKSDFPEVIFLAEAFTRPKVMYRLAKSGFTQSYTYFTWRNSKRELTQYLEEITRTEVREYFRPNFWPNTPDILSEVLQAGGRPAFLLRLVLAATLSSNYGIYGPAYELGVREALTGREEYENSEKYEIRNWDWNREGNLRGFCARLNRIRRENPALQTTAGLRFLETDNDSLLAYGKGAGGDADPILVAVNLDPFHPQAGWLKVSAGEWGLDPAQPYLVHDLLSDDKYLWEGERNFVRLDPQGMPAAIFRLKKRLRRETDFDYFM